MYILNFSIIFLPESNTLHLIDEEENCIKLSSPAGRLLQELIKSNGLTLTRDSLLKSVWEDYGFSGTNNNLNNYTSELRRAFSSLAPTAEIIMTIPKVGLQLNAKIEFTVDSNKKSKKINKKINKNIIFVLSAFMFEIIIFYMRPFYMPMEINNDKHSFLMNLGECTIYSLDKFNTVSKPQLVNNAINYLANEENINCEQGVKLDVFFKSKESISGLKGVVFTGVCSKGNELLREYNSCYSIIKT